MQTFSTPVRTTGVRNRAAICWRRNEHHNHRGDEPSTDATGQVAESNALGTQQTVETTNEVETEHPQLQELMRLSTELGYSVVQTSKLEFELARIIFSKLKNRWGRDIYQSAAESIPVFPRAAAELLIPASLVTVNNKDLIT